MAFSFAGLNAHDIQVRAMAYRSLRDAGMSDADARAPDGAVGALRRAQRQFETRGAARKRPSTSWTQAIIGRPSCDVRPGK